MYHTVKQGEHLSGIAERYGFSDYRLVWNCPENKELREKRENPNVLFPGDRVFIPPKQTKKETRPAGQRHRFQLFGQELRLRVVIEDINDRPVANATGELSIEGESLPLQTNARGLIEAEILKTAELGRLSVRSPDPPFRLEMPVKIGHLDPVETLPGQLARLNNLGYDAGAAADAEDPQVRSAIEEFQCDYGLKVDGICGPATQAKLKGVHGC